MRAPLRLTLPRYNLKGQSVFEVSEKSVKDIKNSKRQIMSDKDNRFHEMALQSSLFKGRSDWYFCYLKSEKIAHVLIMLMQRSQQGDTLSFIDLVEKASMLPQTIVHFVAEERGAPAVLADIFGVLSALRLCTTRGAVNKDNSLILQSEYEQLAQKISESNRLSPFLAHDNFDVPSLPPEDQFFGGQLLAPPALNSQNVAPLNVKDTKGHVKGQDATSSGQQQRSAQILAIVQKYNGVSIKQISAVVKGYSEKTIQRELANLINQKLIRKEGERRWSLYYAK